MNKKEQLTFIDLFAGCGGLSLGLIKSGFKGVFAIEKVDDAFETLKINLIDKKKDFDWPEWLPCKAMTTSNLIKDFSENLKLLKGRIDLIAGGPPCQGFSFAGRRNPRDPRNKLTEEYIKIVKLVQPKFILLENVKGFQAPFHKKGSTDEKVYSEKIRTKLIGLGYTVFSQLLNASNFGVPQKRERFIMIAIRGTYKKDSPFALLEKIIPEFRVSRGIPKIKDITVKQAISDLETSKKELVPCNDFKNFFQIDYSAKNLTKYQKLMREMSEDTYIPNSLRLPKHRDKIKKRFAQILETCTPGKTIPKVKMEAMGTKKNCLAPLHPNKPSRTITTLPDDLLHYSEPRILTVRENARIQSFPDWFEFRGKYTTGGHRRKKECPRYSQVGNAVPPLMSEVLGNTIIELEAKHV